ncbi:hypothetical protein [Streptomyces sp. NPDC096105]|uniref:hypothetical protein n=1 Tax=Streptomyces sp. NPDC096105 TaxID=3366074 RepID=UPI00382ED7F5
MGPDHGARVSPLAEALDGKELSVVERTREIGLMRAPGVSRNDGTVTVADRVGTDDMSTAARLVLGQAVPAG